MLVLSSKILRRFTSKPDYEVVSYSTQEECLEKSKWLIENPKVAFQIGTNARKKTLAEHTFHNRAYDMDIIIKKYVS